MDDVERRRTGQRLANYPIAARLLNERSALREGLTIEQAAATIFAVGHPDVYRTLVIDGEWVADQWLSWVRTTLHTALIEPEATENLAGS